MRLDRFLANLKYGSRKDIARWAKDGKISVNRVVVKDSSKNIDEEHDEVQVGDDIVYYKKNVTLMLNKPSGVITATTDSLHHTVMDLLEEPYFRFDLKIAGRLDIDTEGFLLLSTSGELIHRIISPSHHVKKKYYVVCKYNITHIESLEEGLSILDGRNQLFQTLPATIELLNDKEAYITIEEGKFHQVKRMFEAVDNEVIYLKRVSIGGLILDESLELGEYRELTNEEIEAIFELL